jgi:hypothetical protein
MVSRRQQQLAKHSPRGVIELAYLSALLERRQEGYHSERFNAIKTFFESAVSVVPIESLFHAMANGKREVVLQCCEILSSSEALPKLNLPSEFLHSSIKRVFKRIRQLQQQSEIIYHPERARIRENRRRLTTITGDLQTNLSMVAHEQMQKTKEDEYNKLLNNTCSRINEMINKNRAAGERLCQNSPCAIDLEVIYPSADVKDKHTRKVKYCKAPMTLLTEGRKELNRISEELIAENSGSTEGCSNANSMMLKVLNGLRTDFETCSTLLGAFMESQARIPLEKAGGDKYVNKFAKHASSFGLSVWGLLLLPFKYLNQLISSNVSEDFRQFVIEFSRQVQGIHNYMFAPSTRQFPDYEEKLEFLVGSMKQSWTCNQKYVSYSLERQLEDQCKKRHIFHNAPVDEILDQWNDNFENETLTLVPKEYRRLVARWIKWSLMINYLRESLASQTAVGVIGLVNSGKSKFVRSMFGKQVSK